MINTKKLIEWSKGKSFRFDPDEYNSVGDQAARILARRHYGRNGVVGALSVNGESRDMVEWNAFIGKKDKKNNCIIGHNVILYTYK